MSLQLCARLSGLPLALLLATAPALSQTINGTITDTGEGLPVAAVEVILHDPDGKPLRQVTSDSLGIFRINVPSPGRYTLQLQRIGYEPSSTGEFEIARGEIITIEIRMNTQVVKLEPIQVVEARRTTAPRIAQFYQRAEANRKAGRARVYFREDLEKVHSVRSIFTLFPTRAGCKMSVVVDDLLVPDARDLDFLAKVDEVEGIEIYWNTNQIPPEFQYHRACALMLIWTTPKLGNPFTTSKVITASAVTALFLFLITR